MEFKIKEKYDFDDLLQIMTLLRAPQGGCPWDVEQTHESVRKNFIEETYEVCDAIDRHDDVALCEELGDALLQVVFHAKIAEQRGAFDIENVEDGICKKLVYRHPHIFGETKADTSEKVLENWDKLKKTEKNQKNGAETLAAVPKTFPAVVRAQKVASKAAKAGWNMGIDELADDIRQILANMKDGTGNSEQNTGNLLFLAAALAGKLGTDGEEACQKTTDAFVRDFAEAETGGAMAELRIRGTEKS